MADKHSSIEFGIVALFPEIRSHPAIEQNIFIVCIHEPDMSCSSGGVRRRAEPKVIFRGTGYIGKFKFQVAERAEPILKNRSWRRRARRCAERKNLLSKIAPENHLLVFVAKKFLLRRRSYSHV